MYVSPLIVCGDHPTLRAIVDSIFSPTESSKIETLCLRSHFILLHLAIVTNSKEQQSQRRITDYFADMGEQSFTQKTRPIVCPHPGRGFTHPTFGLCNHVLLAFLVLPVMGLGRIDNVSSLRVPGRLTSSRHPVKTGSLSSSHKSHQPILWMYKGSSMSLTVN